MSTRSIIVVTGQGNYGSEATTRLYKHHDGYPTGNLPIIKRAIAAMNADIEETVRVFNDKPEVMNQNGLVGKIIGEAASQHGMGANIDKNYSELFTPPMLGLQGDLEWIYVVDTTKKTVGIYGGGYTGDGPQETYAKGFKDPIDYIKQLREDCQSEEEQETMSLVIEIEALGFAVNREPKDPKVTQAEEKLKAAQAAVKLAEDLLEAAKDEASEPCPLAQTLEEPKPVDADTEADRLGLGKVQRKRWFEAHAIIRSKSDIHSAKTVAKAKALIKKYQSKPGPNFLIV